MLFHHDNSLTLQFWSLCRTMIAIFGTAEEHRADPYDMTDSTANPEAETLINRIPLKEGRLSLIDTLSVTRFTGGIV